MLHSFVYIGRRLQGRGALYSILCCQVGLRLQEQQLSQAVHIVSIGASSDSLIGFAASGELASKKQTACWLVTSDDALYGS